MTFCIVDADERTHADERGREAERDAYIAQRCSDILGYWPELCDYLPEWHDGSRQLVMNIEKGLLDDEDYHCIHGSAVEEITRRLEGEVK